MRRTLFNSMLILSEKQVRQCLDMKTCVEVNRKALMAVSSGQATVPSRLGLPYYSSSKKNDDNTNNAAAADWSLFKPASLSSSSSSSSKTITTTSETTHMGMKIVSIRSQNPEQYNLPLVPATILHMNPATGIVDAVLAGTYLTGARTAAGSAISTAHRFLHNDNDNKNDNKNMTCQHLTVFGAGLQAECHLHAITTALGYPLQSCTIVNRSATRAEQLAALAKEQGWVTGACNVVLLHDTAAVQSAIEAADCICTTTNTVTPLWDNEINNNDMKKTILKPGCHITGIGSYTPEMQEVPPSAVAQCRVWIDTPEARSVGDLKHLKEDHPVELLGSVLSSSSLSDSKTVSKEDYPCTFFKGVGTAIQDVLTADAVVQKAREMGIGTEIEM